MTFPKLQKRSLQMQYHESKTKIEIKRKIFGVSNDEKTLSTAVLLIIILVDFSHVTSFFRSEQLCTFLWRPKPFSFHFRKKSSFWLRGIVIGSVTGPNMTQKIDLFFAYSQSKAFMRIIRNNLFMGSNFEIGVCCHFIFNLSVFYDIT